MHHAKLPSALCGVLFLLLLVGGGLTACDVSNPGPIEDEALNETRSLPSLVRGGKRGVAEALNWISYTGAVVTQQLTAAGSIGNFGITLAERSGTLLPGEGNAYWEEAQQARYIAENGVQRMRARLDDFSSNALAAEGLLWVGYANRLLGENMCQAVIDGGAPQPRSVYFERAEAAFTEALGIARTIEDEAFEQAALAGRASVRVFRDDWEGAAADAEQVPEDFEFAIEYHPTTQEQYNRIYWANANEPYRAHSVVDTYYEDYYTETEDPRVPWATDPDIPYGDTGRVPWLFQTKYDGQTAPIVLSGGSEMQLILAEAALREGDWQEALGLVNDLRAQVGVPARDASGPAEAWQWLKRERGIDLWMEARRLGDQRRWIEGDVPGAVEDMSGRDLCFPISQDEIETNPNVEP